MEKIKLLNILKTVNYIDFVGNNEHYITGIDRFNENNQDEGMIFWCNDKNLDRLYQLKKGTVLCSNNIDKSKLNSDCNYIIVENPRLAFQKILEQFYVERLIPEISKTAVIHKSVKIGNDPFIGENVVIEKNSVVGDNCIINHNTVIKKNTIIGNNVIIGANNTIGGTGFGYEKDENGDFRLIPHIGNVIIEDNVELGNNLCIDRAVLGSTILRNNVKVDNLVHIAHGVDVGENSVVIANSMIAGSVRIGKNAWISPSSSILNQKAVGKNALVGMGAVVIKDVENDQIVVGNPAKPLKR